MNEQKRINTYEGMFLFPQSALADFSGTVEHLKDLLKRAGAELLSLSKWDERRLAFDIEGNKRGLYLLAHFRAPADRMTALERNCNLSERVLRSLITRADHLTEEQIRAADAQEQLADEIRLRSEEQAQKDESTEKEAVAETAEA